MEIEYTQRDIQILYVMIHELYDLMINFSHEYYDHMIIHYTHTRHRQASIVMLTCNPRSLGETAWRLAFVPLVRVFVYHEPQKDQKIQKNGAWKGCDPKTIGFFVCKSTKSNISPVDLEFSYDTSS